MKCFVGSVAVPAGTGNLAITGVGFQGKAAIFWGNGRTSNGASTTTGTDATLPWFHGIAVDSTHRVAVTNADDFSSAAVVSATDTTKCIKLLQLTTVRFAADFVSWDSDGFTVNFTTASATASIINFMVIGGASCQASLLEKTTPAGTGSQAYTGAGFQPKAIVLLSECHVAAVNAQMNVNIGWGTSATARGTSQSGFDGSAIGVYQRTASIFAIATSSVRREADLTSLNADGFTLNWTTVNTADTWNFYALCLTGGAGDSFKAGSILQKTSGGSQSTTGVGFLPVGMMMRHVGLVAATTVQSSELRAGFGAASSSTHRGSTFYDSISDAVCVLSRSTIYESYADDATPTHQGSADLTSFDSDGFTLNYGTADATAREIIFLAIGPADAGGTPVTDWLDSNRPTYPDRFRQIDIVPSGPMPGRGI